MTRGSFRYLDDCRLIESIYLADYQFIKNAGMADSILSGIVPSVLQFGKQHIDTSSVGGILSSLGDLMVPAMLFKINPILGTLATVAELLGFSPSGIVKSVIDMVKDRLQNGQSIEMEDVNQVGREAIASEAGSINSTGSDDLFLLRSLYKSGQIRSLAFGWGNGTNRSVGLPIAPRTQGLPSIPFLGNSGSILERIFGQLLQNRQEGKAKWLVGGFVVWILKTLLLGAGLIAGGEAIMHLIKPSTTSSNPSSKSNPSNQSNQNPSNQNQSNYDTSDSAELMSILRPTGKGTEIHQNDQVSSSWYVPILGGTLETTLLSWARYVYDGLNSSALLRVNSDYQHTLSILSDSYESEASNMLMPKQFKSLKQVVDTFAVSAATSMLNSKQSAQRI